MGVPLALHVLSGDAGERVVYGDSRGAAVLLLCGSRELPARDLISTETHKVSLSALVEPGGLQNDLYHHVHWQRQPGFVVSIGLGLSDAVALQHLCLFGLCPQLPA